MPPTEQRAAGVRIGAPLQGGVGQPDPIILPSLGSLFARRAVRLDVLAAGHPMSAWLQFMAHLARAQDGAAKRAAVMTLPLAEVQRAASAGMPPLAAVTHRRDPSWRAGLAAILDAMDDAAAPEQAQEAASRLAELEPSALEALADAFLSGALPARQAGEAVYVAAALQVYFAALAAGLSPDALRLLPQRRLCPVCGSDPVAGVITAAGKLPGARYLHCGLCATAWNHVRAVCINCGESRALAVQEIEGGNGAVKAETCDVCHGYAKMLYQASDMQVEPMADDLASLGLDMLVAEGGWSRHAPNPLILGG